MIADRKCITWQFIRHILNKDWGCAQHEWASYIEDANPTDTDHTTIKFIRKGPWLYWDLLFHNHNIR